MSTKKKGTFQLPPSVDVEDSVQAKIKAFTSGGRAEKAVEIVQVEEPVKRGRPALTEETRRTIMALRKDDVQRVEELCLRWKRESDGLTSIKTTMVLRSLLAETILKLETLEGVEDEAHLREMMRELF